MSEPLPNTRPAAPWRADGRRAVWQWLNLLGRTAAHALLLVGVVLALTLALLRIGAPPIEQVLGGRGADLETRAQIRHVLGADQPLWRAWLGTIEQYLKGDLGRSWTTGAAIGPELRQRLARSLALVMPGILLGQLLAWWSLRCERGTAKLEALSWAMIAAGLVVSASTWQWLLGSPGGFNWLPFRVIPNEFGEEWMRQMVVPTLTTALFAFANTFPSLQAGFDQSGTQRFVAAARARGDVDGGLRARLRALRGIAGANLLYRTPLLALAAMMVMEPLYGVPGLGNWLYSAVLDGDRPILLAACGVMALLLAGLKLAEQGWLLFADPRAVEAPR